MAANATAAAVGSARGEMPPASLAEAFRRNIFAKGYVVHLATRLGCSPKDLYRWATDPSNENGEHREPPASIIVPLTIETCRYDVLDHLEHEVGRIACVRPALASGPAPLLERIACVTAEVADVQRDGAEMLFDGVTPDEARAIERDITEAQVALETLRLAVRAAVKKPLTKSR